MAKFIFNAPRFHTNQVEIVKELIKNGHDVDFHVTNIGKTENHELINPILFKPSKLSKIINKIIVRNDVQNIQNFPSAYTYLQTLIKSKADFLIIRNINRYFSIQAAVIARILGIKILFYTQTDLYKFYGLKRKLLTNILLKIFDAAWYTPLKGDDTKYKYHPKNMYFIPFTVRTASKPSDTNNEIKILCIGKFNKRKNHLLLIDSIAALSNKYNIKFAIVGECITQDQIKLKEEIENRIEDYGIQEIVEIKVNINNSVISDIYSQNDLFVLPASNEPASIAVLEAIGYGLPAICSDTCGTKSYIIPNYNGEIFKSNDKFELERLIEKYLVDRNFLIKSKQNCIDYASRHLSPASFYASFSEMIKCKWDISINKIKSDELRNHK